MQAKENLSRVPDGGLIPGQPGRRTVGRKLNLTLTLTISEKERVNKAVSQQRLIYFRLFTQVFFANIAIYIL
jgi:hypothetical protein